MHSYIGQKENLKLSHYHEKTCLRDLRPGKTQTALCSQRLEISDIKTRDIILSRQRTTKALIRLRRCGG